MHKGFQTDEGKSVGNRRARARRGARIKIAAFSASPFFLSGLCIALTDIEDFDLVESSSSASELFECICRAKPNVVVWNLSAFNSEFMNGLIPLASQIPIVAVLRKDQGGALRQLVKDGVKGFLFETCQPSELIRIVRAVSNSETGFSMPIAAMLAAETFQMREASPNLLLLTRAEQQVVGLIVQGLSNKEAAVRLRVSVRTVESHRSAAMEKLQVNNAVELTRVAMRLGFV